MNSKQTKVDPDRGWVLLTAAITAVAGVLVFAIVVVREYLRKFGESGWPEKQETWGQLGDYFGGMVNPAVGIATVFLVFLSIIIQRKEFKATNEALAAQNAALSLQSFEQTFFAWLANYRDLVSSVTYADKRGRDALLMSWEGYLGRSPVLDKLRAASPSEEKYKEMVNKSVSGTSAKEPLNFSEFLASDMQLWVFNRLSENWETIYNETEHHIDSTFRTLYRLIRWVDEQPVERLSPLQKWHYISIVRAQLSKVEMTFLFYNGFTPRGRNFARYINRYALFDNLDFSNDLGIQCMEQLGDSPFDVKAFNSNLARDELVTY